MTELSEGSVSVWQHARHLLSLQFAFPIADCSTLEDPDFAVLILIRASLAVLGTVLAVIGWVLCGSGEKH